MLVIEGKVFFPESDLPDMSSAFAVLFGSYYVLSIEFQVEATTTLEFIQKMDELIFFLREWNIPETTIKRLEDEEEELKEMVSAWNCHRIRPTYNPRAPSGRPSITFAVPSLYGVQNFLHPIELLRSETDRDSDAL